MNCRRAAREAALRCLFAPSILISNGIQKKKQLKAISFLVPRRGFEPRTPCLKGRCSANWARRTGRNPCYARISMAFPAPWNLRFRSLDLLRSYSIFYSLDKEKSILLNNTGHFLFNIFEERRTSFFIFQHPRARMKKCEHHLTTLERNKAK